MLRDNISYEYRAWPSTRMPHYEALHNMFGLGVAEIRIDTYILSPSHPDWLIIFRGGTQIDIKVRAGLEDPLSAWKTPVKSVLPLRRSVVRTLQDAFPTSELPHRVSAPVDLISWLGEHAEIFTVSKRMVKFQRNRCTAELSQVESGGRRAETFCLRANRSEHVMATLKTIPGPRLPNLDYGAWLQGRAVSPAPLPIEQKPQKTGRLSSSHAALLT
ncbi:MAG: hypothetical protein ACK46Q_02490 [Hyphomonas sp.]